MKGLIPYFSLARMHDKLSISAVLMAVHGCRGCKHIKEEQVSSPLSAFGCIGSTSRTYHDKELGI